MAGAVYYRWTLRGLSAYRGVDYSLHIKSYLDAGMVWMILNAGWVESGIFVFVSKNLYQTSKSKSKIKIFRKQKRRSGFLQFYTKRAVVSCFPVSCSSHSALLSSLCIPRLEYSTDVSRITKAEDSSPLTCVNPTMSFSDISSSNMKSSSSRIQVKSESGIDPAVSHLSESLQKLQVGQPYVDSVCRAASIRAPLTVLYTSKF